MLELRGVSAGYEGTTVLRDVDLVVPDASVVALLGSNGAGKTTLLRVGSGLLEPTSGQVLLDGVDVTRWSAHQLAVAGICHVPEGRGIFRTLSVRENLRMQARPGEEDDALERALDAFPRLRERLDQRAGTMSGGEQQMLALAHSYSRRPRLVLLDEVSMGLAPKIVDDIFAFIGRLAEEGTALLVVEQYVTRALAVADLVYLLAKGELVFAGEPGEIESDELFAQYFGADAPNTARKVIVE